MTITEAIETLRANYPDACFEQLREAVDMAINALTAQEQKERDCSTCKHKDLCDAFWTQEIEDAPCRECDELAYQKWEPQELTNNSQKLDSENDEHLATNLQPTCNTHNTLDALDCISRQAAIDVASHECYEFRGLFERIEKGLKELPSAQPEIRCKDCKHWAIQVKDVKGDGLGSCEFHKANFVTGEGYCYWAERREDEML